MRRLSWLLVALAACGRLGFDARTDAASDDASAACTTWGPFATPARVSELASPATDWAPSVSRDGLRMVFSSSRAGTQDLYVSTRAAPDAPWGAPALLPGFATASDEEDDPTLTDDELEIYFGKYMLLGARRSAVDAPFDAAVPIVAGGAFTAVQGAELSSDGLRLYFSARGDSLRLYLMTRASRAEAFSSYAPFDAVPGAQDVGFPGFSSDERELIVSQALTSPQDRDLFATRRATTSEIFPPLAVIPELASTGEDWDPELSADGATLWFASTRPPAQGHDIFVTTRTCLD